MNALMDGESVGENLLQGVLRDIHTVKFTITLFKEANK